MQSFNTFAKLLGVGCCLLCFSAPIAAAQAAGLPATVSAQVAAPMEKVGDGTYRKLGFTVYHATLWAPGGEYSPNKPFAIQLRYARSLSKKTLSEAVIENLREQQATDEATFSRWEEALKHMLPAVKKNDEIVGVSIPHKNSVVYFNGREIARIEDRAFSDAFFSIWFGPKADQALYAQLTGQ